MIPPPDALGRVREVPTTAEQARARARVRAAAKERRQIAQLTQRALLLQCQTCGAIATGHVTHRGILESQGIKVEHGRHTVSATKGGRCGGVVLAFDRLTNEDDAA